MPSLLFLFILLLLVVPYIVLFISGVGIVFPGAEELIPVLTAAIFQSGMSTLLSLALGLLGALGLVSVRSGKTKNIVEVLILLPAFVPTLFIVISWLNFVDFSGVSLQGFSSVVLVHALINLGLVSVLLSKSIEKNISHFSVISRVMGASSWLFLRSILLPLIKVEILYVGFLVFAFCLSSFTVPVMLGDIKALSLEVFIYQQLRVNGDLSVAVGSAIIQLSLLTFVLFLITTIKSKVTSQLRAFSGGFSYDFKLLIVIPVLASLCVVLSEFSGLLNGVSILISDFDILKADIYKAVFGTVLIASASGAVTFVLLCLIGFALNDKSLLKLLYFFQSPSSTLIGLSFLILGVMNDYVLIIVGFAWLNINVLIRLIDNNTVNSLVGQIRTSQIMGARKWLIYRKVIFPQWLGVVTRLSGIAAFWASGEFALSRVVARSDVSLALLSQTFASQYRLNLSTLLVWVMVFIGICFYLLFKGIEYVGSKKYL